VSDTKHNFGVGVMSQNDTFKDVLKASITGLDDDQWEQLHEETEAFNVNQMARWELLDMQAIVLITQIELKFINKARRLAKQFVSEVEISGLGASTASNVPNKDKIKLCSTKSEELQPKRKKKRSSPTDRPDEDAQIAINLKQGSVDWDSCPLYTTETPFKSLVEARAHLSTLFPISPRGKALSSTYAYMIIHDLT
jgi:hypothetical protein